MLSQQIQIIQIRVFTLHRHRQNLHELGQSDWAARFRTNVFDVLLLEIASPDIAALVFFDVDEDAEGGVER